MASDSFRRSLLVWMPFACATRARPRADRQQHPAEPFRNPLRADTKAGSPVDNIPFDTFEALARTADAIAETAEASADVHDRAIGQVPGAAEHAERDRRFAAAERAAAHAYRNHQVPSDEVRQAIREARPNGGAQDEPETSP